MSSRPTTPIVVFKKLIAGGLPPQPSTRDALGTLPARALRYCEPVAAASAFGWYVFPPIGFKIMFDGVDALWTHDGAEDDAWYPLPQSAQAQYPGFADQFNAAAPDDIKGFSPPFLGLTEDNGIAQIWTGLIARTAPDWSLLLRAPANLPTSSGYHHLEGIIETDRWGGNLFFNIRLVNTGAPIYFPAHRPFLQIQPVHRGHYSASFLKNMVVDEGLELGDEDWGAYREAVVRPNCDPERKLGRYAVCARKRQAAEEI